MDRLSNASHGVQWRRTPARARALLRPAAPPPGSRSEQKRALRKLFRVAARWYELFWRAVQTFVLWMERNGATLLYGALQVLGGTFQGCSLLANLTTPDPVTHIDIS